MLSADASPQGNQTVGHALTHIVVPDIDVFCVVMVDASSRVPQLLMNKGVGIVVSCFRSCISCHSHTASFISKSPQFKLGKPHQQMPKVG